MRVVSTVLFVIDSLAVLSTRSHGFLTPATWITGAAEWAVGLIVIVFLWDRRLTWAYFAELRRARKKATPQWRATPPSRRRCGTAGPERAAPGVP